MMYANVDAVEWKGELSEDKTKVVSQGFHVKNKEIPLVELFDYMT